MTCGSDMMSRSEHHYEGFPAACKIEDPSPPGPGNKRENVSLVGEIGSTISGGAITGTPLKDFLASLEVGACNVPFGTPSMFLPTIQEANCQIVKTHRLWLRDDFQVTIDLPGDLTYDERSRLSDFVAMLLTTKEDGE